MSASLCPHLVQEYFERVSDILTAYRPQILKQVEYDKISENLVLRGAVRQEEHQRIFQCMDLEGQVSQMLVVIQNRMWGLENLLAAFMEEHISSWLTQELFRAYMEHLVNPLRKLREKPLCQCVQMPNSILYRGWVKALKSLDSLILKTGTSLGFMKQTMYPTDNMLAFLSDKLAEYTGGDSCSSSTSNQDELVPYGFAPNTSGEVQVAELEEDDINDLISLSETLCIAYHSSSDEATKGIKTATENTCTSTNGTVPATKTLKSADLPGGGARVSRPVQRKAIINRRGSNSKSFSEDVSKGENERTGSSFSEQENVDTDPQKQPSGGPQDKAARQRELIARLSAPKSSRTSTTSSSSVRLRDSPSSSTDPKQTSTSSQNKQRPRSAELNRSVSVPSTSPMSASTSSNVRESKTVEHRSPSEKKQATRGKTHGFVRSKSHAPTSPKSKGRQFSAKSKPTAVARPTVKNAPKKTKSLDMPTSDDEYELEEYCQGEPDSIMNEVDTKEAEDHGDDFLSKNIKLFNDREEADSNTRGDEDNFAELMPGMSSLLLSRAIIANSEEKTKSLAYYQLNFDSYSDNE